MRTISKRALLAVTASILLTAASGAGAQVALLVSGQTTLAVLDADGDGPDSDDCVLTALVSGIDMSGDPISSTIDISSNQSNTPALRACELGFTAFGFKGSDDSSNYAGAYVYEASEMIGGPLPISVEIVDETASPDLDDPVGFNDRNDYVEVRDSNNTPIATGVFCSEGGSPAAEARLVGGPRFLVDLDFYPNATSPTYARVAGPPMVAELAAGGFTDIDAYLPVTSDRRITVALSSDPTDLFVNIDLTALPGCGGVQGVPTFTQSGLVGLMLGLLALGTWALGRREAFGRSLTL